jgi:hypothetical protein
MNDILALLALSALAGLVFGLYFRWIAILISGPILAILLATVLQSKGFAFFCGHRNHRWLPHGQSNRILDRGDACYSPSVRPINHRYLMTSPTMIQASVATTTLPANISGKKRPHPSLRQGLSVGSCGQMALWERPLACRLFATLGVRCILASVSQWGRLEAINGHFPRWSLGRVSVPHSPRCRLRETNYQGAVRFVLLPGKAGFRCAAD